MRLSRGRLAAPACGSWTGRFGTPSTCARAAAADRRWSGERPGARVGEGTWERRRGGQRGARGAGGGRRRRLQPERSTHRPGRLEPLEDRVQALVGPLKSRLLEVRVCRGRGWRLLLSALESASKRQPTALSGRFPARESRPSQEITGRRRLHCHQRPTGLRKAPQQHSSPPNCFPLMKPPRSWPRR